MTDAQFATVMVGFLALILEVAGIQNEVRYRTEGHRGFNIDSVLGGLAISAFCLRIVIMHY